MGHLTDARCEPLLRARLCAGPRGFLVKDINLSAPKAHSWWERWTRMQTHVVCATRTWRGCGQGRVGPAQQLPAKWFGREGNLRFKPSPEKGGEGASGRELSCGGL